MWDQCKLKLWLRNRIVLTIFDGFSDLDDEIWQIEYRTQFTTLTRLLKEKKASKKTRLCTCFVPFVRVFYRLFCYTPCMFWKFWRLRIRWRFKKCVHTKIISRYRRIWCVCVCGHILQRFPFIVTFSKESFLFANATINLTNQINCLVYCEICEQK